jgi:rod shape-determining protein MreD
MPTNTAFWISALSALLMPLYAPQLHVLYFAPYLVFCFYRFSRYQLLWKAAGCGLILDLLSSGSFFGLTAVNYCLTCWLLYGQTRNFFEDKITTLPLMTFLFSFISTGSATILSFFCNSGYSFSFSWVVTDLIAMPLVDALYALLFYSLPHRAIKAFIKAKILRKK